LAAVEQKANKAEGAKENEEEFFVYDTPHAMVPARVLENPLWYEASIAADGDALWYAWLEFSPGQGDQVLVGESALRELAQGRS
jgi:hypothetical protein